MSDMPPKPNENDERKLWFEYVKTLNERHLQTSQRSGVSSYFLLATLVGLLYRFGPEIPQFLAQSDKARAAIVCFVLSSVVISSFLIAIAAVEMFCAGVSDFRAIPKSSEALLPLFYGAFTVVAAALICLEAWTAHYISSQSKLAQYLLVVHILWLTTNIASPIIIYRRLTKKAKNIRNPVPRFSPLRYPRGASLPASLWAFGLSVLGAISLIRYLETLPSYGLQPFKAAGIALIALIIAGYLVVRSIWNASREQYFALERDIVLNGMTSTEIRERYLRDLSGPDMAQWLDQALAALARKDEHLQREQESAEKALNEISGISKEYPAERKQRATLATGKLREALRECVFQHHLLSFQTNFFAQSYRTQEETEALQKRFQAWSATFKAFEEKSNKALMLLEELGKIPD